MMINVLTIFYGFDILFLSFQHSKPPNPSECPVEPKMSYISKNDTSKNASVLHLNLHLGHVTTKWGESSFQDLVIWNKSTY